MNPRFTQITLLHGRDELTDGAVARLEETLHRTYPMTNYTRPLIPDVASREALAIFKEHHAKRLQPDSLIVGFERGGLLACALQSEFPALRLSAFAINAPTFDISLRALPWVNGRAALYSSAYPPIKDRCNWASITPLAFDVPWLAQGHTNFYPLAYLISAFSKGLDMDREVRLMFPIG